jgi:hypothetical protein
VAAEQDKPVANVRWDALRFLFPSASKRVLGKTHVPKKLTLDAMGSNRNGIRDRVSSCGKTEFAKPAYPLANGSFEVENCMFFGGDGPLLAYTGQNLIFKNNEVKYFDYSGHHQEGCRDDGLGLLIVNSDGSSGETFEQNTIWMTGAAVGYRPGPRATVRSNIFAFIGDLHSGGAAVQVERLGAAGTTVDRNWIMYTGSRALSVHAAPSLAPMPKRLQCGLNITAVSASELPAYDQVVDNETTTFNVFYRSGQVVLRNDGQTVIRNTGYWVSKSWAGRTSSGTKKDPTRPHRLKEYYQLKTDEPKSTRAMFYLLGQAAGCHNRSMFVGNIGQSAIDTQIDEKSGTVSCNNPFKNLTSTLMNIPDIDSAAQDLLTKAEFRTVDNSIVASMVKDFDNFDFRPVSNKSVGVGAYDYYNAGDYTYAYNIPGRRHSVASFPVPPHGSCSVKTDAHLMYRPAAGFNRHWLQMLDDKGKVTMGRYYWGESNVFVPTKKLEACKLYRWRVDVEENLDGGSPRWIKGLTWQFMTACPNKVYNDKNTFCLRD